MTGPTLLAHAGEGATWQALLVVASLGLVAIAILAVLGRVRLSEPDDLVLPLASVAVGSSVAPLGSAVLSDWVGWAFPVGVVALVAVVVAATTPLSLTWRSPLTAGALAVAAVAGFTLHQPLTLAWHPPPDFLPVVDDVEVTITSPTEGAQVPAGQVEVTVEISGGSVQAGLLDPSQLPTDPEEAGQLAVALDGDVIDPAIDPACTLEAPCRQVRFPLEIEPGEHVLAVEYRRGDGVPMTPLVTDRVTVTAR